MKFATAVRTTLHKTVVSLVAIGTVAFGVVLSQGSAAATPASAGVAPMATTATWQAPRLTRMVAEAKHQTTLGISYSSGGGHGALPAPLNSHVDCSGFVREMYNYAFGVDIGNGSGDGIVRLSGKFVQTSQPVVGDVALFGNSGHAPAYHAGIYIGVLANGHPAIAASPSTGSNIKVQQWFDRYWHADLMGYWHYRGATAADSGPLSPPKLTGSFDVVAGIPGGFRTSGWAVDPQGKAGGATVAVVVDGRFVARLATNIARVDVNRSVGTTGNHGFAAQIPFPIGRHTVCLAAEPVGTSSAATALGCRSVTVPVPTKGSLESVTGGVRSVSVSGWAFDPAAVPASNTVRIVIDGKPAVDTRASLARPDVNRSTKITGNHGFAVRVAALPGRHAVCATSFAASAASYSVVLSCRTVVVAAAK